MGWDTRLCLVPSTGFRSRWVIFKHISIYIYIFGNIVQDRFCLLIWYISKKNEICEYDAIKKVLQAGGPCIGKRRRNVQGVPPLVVAWDMRQAQWNQQKQLFGCPHHGPDLKNTSAFKWTLVYRIKLNQCLYTTCENQSTPYSFNALSFFEGFPATSRTQVRHGEARPFQGESPVQEEDNPSCRLIAAPYMCSQQPFFMLVGPARRSLAFQRLISFLVWGRVAHATGKPQRSDKVVGCVGLWNTCIQSFPVFLCLSQLSPIFTVACWFCTESSVHQACQQG